MNKNIIVIVGTIMLGISPVLIEHSTAKWGWWLGQVMLVVGPILMGTRAMSSLNQEMKTNRDD